VGNRRSRDPPFPLLLKPRRRGGRTADPSAAPCGAIRKRGRGLPTCLSPIAHAMGYYLTVAAATCQNPQSHASLPLSAFLCDLRDLCGLTRRWESQGRLIMKRTLAAASIILLTAAIACACVSAPPCPPPPRDNTRLRQTSGTSLYLAIFRHEDLTSSCSVSY
jgi:hypothetical protein